MLIATAVVLGFSAVAMAGAALAQTDDAGTRNDDQRVLVLHRPGVGHSSQTTILRCHTGSSESASAYPTTGRSLQRAQRVCPRRDERWDARCTQQTTRLGGKPWCAGFLVFSARGVRASR